MSSDYSPQLTLVPFGTRPDQSGDPPQESPRSLEARPSPLQRPMSTASTVVPSCYLSSATSAAAAIMFDSRSPSPAVSEIGPFPRMGSPTYIDERFSAMTGHKIGNNRLPTITPSTVGTASSSSSQHKSLDVISQDLVRHRATVLETIGLMLDEGLLDKEESSRAVLLATQGASHVSILSDLLSSRPTMPGKAEFLKMYLSALVEDAKKNEATSLHYHHHQQQPLPYNGLYSLPPHGGVPSYYPSGLMDPAYYIPAQHPGCHHTAPPSVLPPQMMAVRHGGTPPGRGKESGGTPPLRAATCPSESDSDDSRKQACYCPAPIPYPGPYPYQFAQHFGSRSVGNSYDLPSPRGTALPFSISACVIFPDRCVSLANTAAGAAALGLATLFLPLGILKERDTEPSNSVKESVFYALPMLPAFYFHLNFSLHPVWSLPVLYMAGWAGLMSGQALAVPMTSVDLTPSRAAQMRPSDAPERSILAEVALRCMFTYGASTIRMDVDGAAISSVIGQGSPQYQKTIGYAPRMLLAKHWGRKRGTDELSIHPRCSTMGACRPVVPGYTDTVALMDRLAGRSSGCMNECTVCGQWFSQDGFMEHTKYNVSIKPTEGENLHNGRLAPNEMANCLVEWEPGYPGYPGLAKHAYLRVNPSNCRQLRSTPPCEARSMLRQHGVWFNSNMFRGRLGPLVDIAKRQEMRLQEENVDFYTYDYYADGLTRASDLIDADGLDYRPYLTTLKKHASFLLREIFPELTVTYQEGHDKVRFFRGSYHTALHADHTLQHRLVGYDPTECTLLTVWVAIAELREARDGLCFFLPNDETSPLQEGTVACMVNVQPGACAVFLETIPHFSPKEQCWRRFPKGFRASVDMRFVISPAGQAVYIGSELKNELASDDPAIRDCPYCMVPRARPARWMDLRETWLFRQGTMPNFGLNSCKRRRKA
ncbi:hypothetical protein FOL47_008873 [Perkinsus chesapeaki]|uniref:Uncharacterized protein n=1 Tax=Perkinsus chesapeaki TaxID=330153 RepID=A0A7J6MSX5_PERCH|nr:hypothetical protein FOL47_008873 [Perkinsus chesapeaki]